MVKEASVKEASGSNLVKRFLKKNPADFGGGLRWARRKQKMRAGGVSI